MTNYKLVLLLKLCTTENLFKYLKQKYSKEQVKALNQFIRTRHKLCSLQTNNVFLNKCLLNKVAPQFILNRISRSKLKHSISVEKIFMKSDILSNNQLSERIRMSYNSQLSSIRSWLSFLDLIRVLKSVTTTTKAVRIRKLSDQDNLIMLLHKRRFGNNVPPSSNNIFNYSKHVLTEDEKFVLSHGLNFNIPPKSLKREDILAEFEVLAGQLSHHTPKSVDELNRLRTKLADLAFSYHATPIDGRNFVRKDFFKILNKIKKLDKIVITKPDKGAGVVILDKEDYLSKMKCILEDSTKFVYVGPSSTHDHTEKVENKLRRRLLQLFKGNLISRSEYERIRPVGSQRPRLYGLPKTHKPNVPLRPILSMVGSTRHKLAQWLTELLKPVEEHYSHHTVQDSFTFSKLVQ